MSKALDITGHRYGRLVAVSYEGKDNQKQALWKCICDCGNEVITRGSSLRAGVTQSCGCLNIDKSTDRLVSHNKTHGEFGTRLYRVWAAMLNRCRNPKHNRYQHYGGRGIRVCDEWMKYENFKEWAMSAGYDPNAPRGACTIDRIDVDGNYEPSNCRWVDSSMQAKNKRRN